MTVPSKILPPNFRPAGGIGLKNIRDVTTMLVWSIVLPIITGFAVLAVLLVSNGGTLKTSYNFTLSSPMKLVALLGGLLLVTFVMVIIHEGLHGLVFWYVTRERPSFAFKWYYASACARGWYLPRSSFLVATLLPLFAITAAGLALLPLLTGEVRYLLIMLILFNSSGCAGDLLVAIRLLRLPNDTLSFDTGDQVQFFTPVQI